MPRRSARLRQQGPTATPPARPVVGVDTLYTTKEAAALLGLAPKTLDNWRSQTPVRGPRFQRVGGRIRYRASDLDEYLDSERR